ncbi:MAG: D-alanine--D-alanine ligase [Clostridia bacterium]|nr:D-alanine--D-alanine ligase [Clostridia bacterium]
MSFVKLGILAGGSSAEREVSFKSCENLVNTLDKNKYDIHIYSLRSENDKEWIYEIMKDEPDVVVSALHGGLGENGSIQGLLNCINVPYIGSKVLASALCIDKKRAKTVLEANHIQTAADVFIKKGESVGLYGDEIRQIGFPIIVKPNKGGSSIGIEIVTNFEELDNAVKNIEKKYNDDALAEKFIKGKEITCCVFENGGNAEVMAVLEVNKKGEIFDYEDKYERGVSSALSKMPEFMQDMVKTIAAKAFKLLKCNGYACVDMIVMEEQIYVIEVNTLPGLTENSLIPKACQSYGIKFGDFMDMMIGNEINVNK